MSDTYITMTKEKLQQELDAYCIAGYRDCLTDIALYFRDLKDGFSKFSPDNKSYSKNEELNKGIDFLHIELGGFLEWIKEKK